ncbi:MULTISPECIES: HK97 family phage prohead protease [unclassified Sphingobium]|uniref:HK97 family phage prohead protease n=1 Tax=unclassified Sphingobium TaxID=2611147 RepID=UPI0022257C75|nr:MULTISPECIES: HK97 family phage prohead protease [unclassified Sphingobium]MCW2393690.1 HK97 family phage prohead protease [Sphingobium sp. B8D3B]MCW2417203.1 HK97 family phage prohead protease [Sphingobium sp. B8D3C]
MSAGTVRFAGYAAIFDKIDQGGDVIAPGAFSASLSRRAATALPLLWQHRAGAVIGRIDHVTEDARGLRVIGTISASGATAEQAKALLRDGRIEGLSFGYRVVAAQGHQPRRLHALDLVEVSLVTHPMQPLARVHAVEAG